MKSILNQLTVCLEAYFILSEGLCEVIRWVSCILPVEDDHSSDIRVIANCGDTWMGNRDDKSDYQQSVDYLEHGRG